MSYGYNNGWYNKKKEYNNGWYNKEWWWGYKKPNDYLKNKILYKWLPLLTGILELVILIYITRE